MMQASASAQVTVDEELWFGSPGDDKELEDRASKSMAAVAARVLGAKPFPAAARKLEELTRTGAAKIEQVVGVLESDPGLSMRLLRLVNSAGYALRVRCTSVRHAAALVGMRRLHQLATTAAVLDLFETDKPAVKSLLNHAAVVGAFCRYLAVHVDLAPDELFTCGFLHDIGKLMLIDAEGAPYLELVERAGDAPDALHLLEQEKYGFDHAVLGAHVLKNWRIPNPVPRVVAWHHNVARAYQADPAIAAMVQTLRLADQLSYVVRTHPELEGIALAAQNPAATYLGVSEAQLSSMWADLTRLSQRINAVPGTDQAELIPRQDSVPPSLRPRGKKSKLPGTTQAPAAGPSMPPSVAAGPISEMPKHFVCVVCKKASFGNRCPVCTGHVCAQHQVGPEQWCTECTSAYALDVGTHAFPLWERLTALGIVVGAGMLSLVVAVLAGRPVLGALLGSVLLSSLCVLLVLVGRRFWLKKTFMRSRAQAHAGDEPALPLGLTMPAEPSIALLSDAPEDRITERINPPPASAGLPALFSVPPAAAGRSAFPPSVPPADSVAPRARGERATRGPAAGVPAVLSAVPAAVPAQAAPVAPRTVPSAQPPAAEDAPATAVNTPSARPDAGWRPVERTEPALPLSKHGADADLRRLAEGLPSLRPAPEPPPPDSLPSEPPRAADAVAAPTTAHASAASDDRLYKTATGTEIPPPLAAAAPPPAPEVRAVPAVNTAPPALALSELAAARAPAASEGAPHLNGTVRPNGDAATPTLRGYPPANGSSAAQPEPAALPGDRIALPAASAPAHAAPTLETPPLVGAAPESSSPLPLFVPAACNAVAPQLLVACRPVSLKPQHYACSPLAGR